MSVSVSESARISAARWMFRDHQRPEVRERHRDRVRLLDDLLHAADGDATDRASAVHHRDVEVELALEYAGTLDLLVVRRIERVEVAGTQNQALGRGVPDTTSAQGQHHARVALVVRHAGLRDQSQAVVVFAHERDPELAVEDALESREQTRAERLDRLDVHELLRHLREAVEEVGQDKPLARQLEAGLVRRVVEVAGGIARAHPAQHVLEVAEARQEPVAVAQREHDRDGGAEHGGRHERPGS